VLRCARTRLSHRVKRVSAIAVLHACTACARQMSKSGMLVRRRVPMVLPHDAVAARHERAREGRREARREENAAECGERNRSVAATKRRRARGRRRTTTADNIREHYILLVGRLVSVRSRKGCHRDPSWNLISTKNVVDLNINFSPRGSLSCNFHEIFRAADVRVATTTRRIVSDDTNTLYERFTYRKRGGERA